MVAFRSAASLLRPTRFFGAAAAAKSPLPADIPYFEMAEQEEHTKSPMEMVEEVPVIEVDGLIAVCDGGTDPALGHPREFIQLNKVDVTQPETCKYCGLRYVQKAGAHH